MKKVILTIVAAFMLGLTAQAQSFVLGVKGGISATNVTVEDVQSNPLQYKDPENIAGYHVGLFTRLQLLGLFVQPEALFASTGGKLTLLDNQNATQTRTEELKFTRLDVPLMIGYNFFKILRVQAGPVAAILLSAQQEGKDIDSYLNETDWGWQAGLGVDISSLTVDLRYERINRHYTNEAQQSDFALQNQQFLLSLGYKFIK